MALAPDTAPWYRRFRMLIGIYLIATAFGVREYMLVRSGRTVEPETAEWSRMAEVVSTVNPADADSEYLLAMEALKAGDGEAYVRHMETALAKNPKHNNLLLSEYAHHLIRMQAPFDDIDRALNWWRENHQLSFEILELPMGVGPNGPGDQNALRRELDAIDWIYKYELQPPQEGFPGWRALIQFEPAIPASIRDAIEAVSILALPPEMRGQYRIRCISFEECRPMLRSELR